MFTYSSDLLGDRFPEAECGLWELKLSRHAFSVMRAAACELKSVRFWHSSRSLPLKLSMKAFWVRFVGPPVRWLRSTKELEEIQGIRTRFIALLCLSCSGNDRLKLEDTGGSAYSFDDVWG